MPRARAGRSLDAGSLEPFPDDVPAGSILPKVNEYAPVIAIDGPSASGKGTIASRVAKTFPDFFKTLAGIAR